MTSSTLTDGLFIKFPHPLFSRQLSLEKAPRNRQSGHHDSYHTHQLDKYIQTRTGSIFEWIPYCPFVFERQIYFGGWI